MMEVEIQRDGCRPGATPEGARRGEPKGEAGAAFSMENDELAAMVKSIRNVEKAIGRVVYPESLSSIKGREFGRSLYVAEDVAAGELITEKNVRSVRPGFGLHPKHLSEILGKTAARDLKKGERFSLDMI